MKTVDVAIVGGGLAGMTTAIGLANVGLNVAVVDMMSPDITTLPDFDGRSSAIAYASCQLLETLGIWPLLADDAQPILEIRVTDGPSLLNLHFDYTALGDGPLGNLVENRHTRVALIKRMQDFKNIQFFAPNRVTNIITDDQKTQLTLDDGQIIQAPLLLGVDGRTSSVRKHIGANETSWPYHQHGIVATIEHSESHCGIAHERFLPSGPFAILPLTGNRSSLVWSEKSHLAETVMGLSDRAFAAEIQKRIGGFLGDIKVIGGRWSYPLTWLLIDRYIGERTALIGDAAHGMHPIAGQGLNLGLRDVAALVEVVADAARTGTDIGSPVVLERYQRWRRSDGLILMGVTDALTHLFSNDIGPVKLARDVGLAVVDKIDPLKKLLMSHARGTVGELPKLLRGEPV